MLDKKILEELQGYLEARLPAIIEKEIILYSPSEKCMDMDSIMESISPLELENFINSKKKQSLQEVLFGFIDRTGATDAKIYKKAGIDRKLFSKIRSNPDYKPGKNTITALALALELEQEETDELLSSAGYSLSDNDTTDLIIQFCIERRIYDLHKVNHALHYFGRDPLTKLY